MDKYCSCWLNRSWCTLSCQLAQPITRTHTHTHTHTHTYMNIGRQCGLFRRFERSAGITLIQMQPTVTHIHIQSTHTHTNIPQNKLII